MVRAKRQETQTAMISGSIGRQLFRFCIPLLLSNLFQLLYNTVDSIIVGNFIGSAALAAVGAATPIVNLFVSFFVGLSAGAGVVVARYYGAQDSGQTQKAAQTFLAFALLIGLALSVLGCCLTRHILVWSGVPEDILPQAEEYLSICFIGNVFVTVYNAGAGVLQAVGDTRHPLCFLAISSCVNMALDLALVPLLGVRGAATATILSQCISAALIVRLLAHTKETYRISLKRVEIDGPILMQIIRYGIPAGVQQTIVSLSNVVVQSYVNAFGASVIAGYSSANKFDNFILMPINSFGLAATTFTGQNLGARQYERARRGIRTALAMSVAIVVVLGAVAYLNADRCISIFSQEEDVIKAGATLIRIMCPFYSALCFHQVFTGALRACGKSYIPMLTAILAFVVYRQLFFAIVLPRVQEVAVIGWGFSSSWVLGAVLTSTYYFASHCIPKEEKDKTSISP